MKAQGSSRSITLALLVSGGVSLVLGLPRVRADVKLPALFSEHMVVQAGKPVLIWGWASPGERVSVALGGQSHVTRAGDDGKWTIALDPMVASDHPRTLRVVGANRLELSDVLVGEVWLCAGQSNMEMQIRGLHGEVDRADEEIAAAKYPRIRLFVHRDPFSIDAAVSPPERPFEDRAGSWIVCSPETVASFSALGYFFARDVHQRLHVPVGIVHASVGGTPIEAWTSREAQLAEPRLEPLLADWRKRLDGFDAQRALGEFGGAKRRWLKNRAAALAAGQPAPKAPARFRNLEVMAPGRLFDGVIAPLVPYAVRGVLWYQGERNAAGPFTQLYEIQLETLVDDWRKRWNEPLDFAWVQLPRFGKEQQQPSEPDGWGVAVREAQRRCLRLPRTSMAITIDFGGVRDGHPTNKADFAARLVRLAMRDVYGQPVAQASGPLLRSAERRERTWVLTFDEAEGLCASSGDLQGFAVAGTDRKFVWAKARVEGDRVVVSSDEIPEPAAVRYGWAGNPRANLVNAAGLPASPFRSDDWK